MNESFHKCRDAAEAYLTSMTEQEHATWLAQRGRKIVLHKGRHWLETYPGFYTATHLMSKMTAQEATRPTTFCWGFRAPLDDAYARKANGSLPLHLLRDIDNYTLQNRSPRCRNKLRNLHKRVRIVELHKPDLLLDQGYDVLRSAHDRNHYGSLPKCSEYQKAVERYYDSGRGLIIGGLVDGKLEGYLTCNAVDETAYIEDLFLDTQYLRANIGLGLFFEFIQICRRSNSICQVIHGQHAREVTGLCRHKEELGLSVVQIPTRVWFAPLTDRIVKQLRPHAYYRLTGHD